MADPLHRLYRTKLTLLAMVLFASGLALIGLNSWLRTDAASSFNWLRYWPLGDIGSALFTTGGLGVALQYLDGQDSEVRATQRLERVLTAATPAMRDAVIDGFAFKPDDLARVATDDTLDKIATNALAIRLGDASFAAEIYDDVRAQAIAMPERLHDARIDIRLSMDRGSSTGRAPMFVTTVRWEYTLTPVFQTRRFLCVSDLDEYRELSQDTAATSAWYIRPEHGIDAGDRTAFELVEYAVEGKVRPIRRTAKAGSQAYSVSLGAEAVTTGKPITVAYTYRTMTAVNGHLLQLRVDQPTRGLTVELDYSESGIKHVNVLDYIASSRPTRVAQTPKGLPGQVVSVDFDGWVFPRSGVAFVWTAPGHTAHER